jgi:hypothetical protein
MSFSVPELELTDMNTNSSEFRLNHYDLFMNLVPCMHFVLLATLLELASGSSNGNIELYNDAPTGFFPPLGSGRLLLSQVTSPQVHWYIEEDQLYFNFFPVVFCLQMGARGS